LITVASEGVPVYSVSPNSNAKNGVSATGGVAKLIVELAILKSTPGFNITLSKLTIIEYAVGGVNATPPTVMLNVCVIPLNVNESIFLYCPICGVLPK
jgi:hypothetical protein